MVKHRFALVSIGTTLNLFANTQIALAEQSSDAKATHCIAVVAEAKKAWENAKNVCQTEHPFLTRANIDAHIFPEYEKYESTCAANAETVKALGPKITPILMAHLNEPDAASFCKKMLATLAGKSSQPVDKLADDIASGARQFDYNAEQLFRSGGKNSIPALANLAKNEKYRKQCAALLFTCSMDIADNDAPPGYVKRVTYPPETIANLESCISDAAPDVRGYAIYALGYAQNLPATTREKIVTMLTEDPAGIVRMHCAQSITNFGTRATNLGEAEHVIKTLNTSMKKDKDYSVQNFDKIGLLAMRDYPDLVTKIAGLDMSTADLGLSGGSWQRLVQNVSDKEGLASIAIKTPHYQPLSRTIAALKILGNMGPAAADQMPKLLEAAKASDRDGDFTVRAAFAETFGKVVPSTPSAVPLLKTWLDDPHRLVRHNALVALGSIGHSAADAVPKLKKVNNDPWLDQAAKEAIDKIK